MSVTTRSVVNPVRVLRSPGQLWTAWLLGGFFGLLGAVEVVHPAGHGDRAGGVTMILFALLAIFLFVIRTGVWITDRGIQVRNPVSSYGLSWTEIKGFRIGRHGVFSKCLLIDTMDGRTRYAFAVQVANVSKRNPERGFVAVLNQALAVHRNPTP